MIVLTRQKIILALLEQAGHPINATTFVKMVFLLRQKTKIKEDRTFYDFLPYKHGPFSFSLYRELGTMRDQGYVLRDEESIQLCSKTRALTRRAVDELPEATISAVSSIVARYGTMENRALLKTVYTQYQWYASKSELKDLVSKPVEEDQPPEVAVYTVGYEGKSVDGFFDGLLRHGIQAILDVRANPISRKYGFARKSLDDISTKLGLTYRNLPELGIAGEQRTELNTWADYQILLDRYEREMLPKRKSAVERLVSLLFDRPSALLCMEKDVTCCHRGRLANAAAAISGLPIRHL